VAIATLITVLLRLWVKHLLIRTQFAIGVSRQRGLRQKKGKNGVRSFAPKYLKRKFGVGRCRCVYERYDRR
jgi:hypothetical protein